VIIAQGESEAINNEKKAMIKAGKKKKQGSIQNTLHLAACSDLRMGILITLKSGKRSLRELRAPLGVSSTTAIHALRELEKEKLVFQAEDRGYALTKIGEIIALKLVDITDVIGVLKQHEAFWLEHDLSGIPPYWLEKIGDLSYSSLIADTPTDLFKSHTTLLQIFEDAKEVKGIYPIFHFEYLKLIEELVKRRKIDVELIVTNDVLEDIAALMETEEAFKNFLHEPNFALFAIDKDIKIAFTLTDSIFYLGLFAGNGIYDHNSALISDDEKALSWGRELHEHYRKLSTVVDL
jgi:predicted transcriptional regulator